MKARLISPAFMILTLLAPSSASTAQISAGDLVVVDVATRSVLRVDPAAGTIEEFSKGGLLVGPREVAISEQGRIYVIDVTSQGGTGAVIELDPQTGDQSVLSSGGFFVSPYDITVCKNGDIYVVDLDAFGDLSGVIRVDPLTGEQDSVTANIRLAGPHGVVCGEDFLYVVDSGAVITIDLLSNELNPQSILSTGGFLDTPVGIGLDSNGDLVVTDVGGFPGFTALLIRVDPTTGDQQILSSGGFMGSPGGVVSTSAGRIYVAESSVSCEASMGDPFGQILEVDGVTGDQSVLACNPFLTVAPFGIAVFPGEPVQVRSGSWGELKSVYR